MLSNANVRPGQVVSFVYNKGTVPGSRRLVEITEIDANFIKGDDLNQPENDRFRNFSKSEIAGGNVRVVASENEEVIRPSDFLKDDKVSAETALAVYTLLNPKRKSVRYDAENSIIVARRDDLPRVEFSVTDRKTSVEFVNDAGERIGLIFDYQKRGPSFDLPHKMVCRMDPDILKEFGSRLADHVKTVGPSAGLLERQKADGNKLYSAVFGTT